MKKFNMLVLLAMTSFLGFAQIEQVSYRGAFAPAPAAMWTDTWTNFDPQNTVYERSSSVDVTDAITTNTTWDATKKYVLKGLIYVKNGATLTIPAGTLIVGDHTYTGSALVITKGSKLMAVGTVQKPIVFTSDKAPGSRDKGDWGGLILLGKSTFNINAGVNNIEGIAPTADTQYGGGTTPDANDSSGIMKYIRIEFPGYVYAPNNEINGLTFGAVGRGTVIDYIQVSHSNDDSFEWFGGTVDCKHLVAFRGLDDDFDTDNGFSGKVQFGLGIRDPHVSDDPAISTSEGFESDNNANATEVNPFTTAVFTNFTMVGPMYRKTQANAGTFATGYKRGARIRRASQLKIFNTVFMDYNEGVHIDGVSCENYALAGSLKFGYNILAGTVTTSKITQINSSGSHNANFNIATWYSASNNTTLSDSTGLVTTLYGSDATVYTGLDYRPATNSALLNSANYSDSVFSTTTLVSTVCGFTLAALNSPILAVYLPNATGYRFEITNVTDNTAPEVITNNSAAGYGLKLTSLSNGGYFGKVYSIRVAVKDANGTWGDYGSACSVTTPSLPASTKINAGQAGTTVTTLNTAIYADQVVGATAYKFEIKENGVLIEEKVNPTSFFFNLRTIAGGAQYGKTYTIKVAAQYNGTEWTAYGRSSSISTPAASPLTSIDTQCNTTIAAFNTVIYATPVISVTSYQFEVSLNGTVLGTYINPTSYFFRLSNAIGTVAANTNYTVKVATLVNGTWGAFGTACTISTGSSIVEGDDTNTSSVLAVYPNPFNTTFKVGANAAAGTVDAKVYDMNGNLVDQRSIEGGSLNSTEFGSNLRAGHYFVVLTQGAETKTMQVDKK